MPASRVLAVSPIEQVERYGDPRKVTGSLLEIADASGQNWADAELYRLRGALLIGAPSPEKAEAETCFHKALAIARKQGSRDEEPVNQGQWASR